MKKLRSPLRREWYLREPDLTMARQFRNGEDLSRVIEKLQHISLDGQVTVTPVTTVTTVTALTRGVAGIVRVA